MSKQIQANDHTRLSDKRKFLPTAGSEAKLEDHSKDEYVDVASSRDAPPTAPQLEEHHPPKSSQSIQSVPRKGTSTTNSESQGTGIAEAIAAAEAERDAEIDAVFLRLIHAHGERHFRVGIERFLLQAKDANDLTWRGEEYRPVLLSRAATNERIQDDSGNDNYGNENDGNGDDENVSDGGQDPDPAQGPQQTTSISFTFNHCVVQGVYRPRISDSPNVAGDV
ncbi:hypothetical protein BDZ45DRAFT_743484 [Acephala macrosclerotiorum]|nr:hypothetical protein BDZ45DRAFT_743484 [Acephala macrosclerotiorum]